MKTIAEALCDKKLGEAVRKPSPWTMGHIQGNRDAKRLALKGEKQSAKGLRAYIQKATENHPDEKWREGYKFAFQLMFSAQLTDPIPDGQLPFANARQRPYGPFGPKRGKNPLKENEEGEFQKLMDLATDSNEGSGIQALEMYEFFDLTEEQIKALYNVVLYTALKDNIEDVPQVLEMRPPEYTEQEMAVHRDMATKAIIKQSENPERLLKAIGYDFHKEFTEVFGITPPRDQEFTFEPEGVPWNTNGEDIFLVVLGNVSPAVIVFSLWFEGSNENNPSDPFIYLKNTDGEESWFEWNPITDSLIYEASEKTIDVTKEQVSQIIKRETGVSFGGEPINEKVDRNYLFQMISEVLREEEDDDADFTKKIQDFLDSKDLESLKSALNLLDIYTMSGLIEKEEANNLKKKMYKVIQDERMVVSDPEAVYEFINSEEFSSSFDKFAMNDFRRETFSDLFIYSERDIDTIIKLILGDGFEGRIDHYEGNPFNDHYVIEDLKGQEEANEILTRFKQFQGNGSPFAALVTADGDAFVLIGSFATSIANFGRDSKELFGYLPKTKPEPDGERLSLEEGEGNPYLAKKSPLFDGKDVDYHIKIVKKMFDDWFMVIIFDEGHKGYLRIDYNSQNKSYTIAQKRDKIATLSTKDEMLAKVKEVTNIDLTDVGPSHYERDQMEESVLETEENFGRESRGDDLLQEAWDSQWPSHFSKIKERIKEFTDKGKAAEDILAKYAIEAMSFNHLGFKTIWNAYGRLFKAFVRTYVRDEGDLTKVRKLITKSLNVQTKEDWGQKFLDVRRDKGNEGALRLLNKLVSSLDKQIRKIWGTLEDKGVDWNNVKEEFDREITQVIQKQQFAESGMITSRILEIINFVNMDKGDDNARKLAAFYKKIKQAANSPEIDVSAIADEVNIVQLSLDFVEDQILNIDMTLCPDAEVGAPCVMHQFDDGFFWYDISADTCELTARKMNSCGDASMDGSELFNLMSHSETGKPRWHVTVEWNEEEKAIIQVLGNANTVPKEEYWPHIKWLYEKYGKPEISNYAWEHVKGFDVATNVYKFLQYLGVKPSLPDTEDWGRMKQQIADGFYNVYSWEGEMAPDSEDFSRLKWMMIGDRVAMSIRIKRRLVPADRMGEAAFGPEDVREYKAAAKQLETNGSLNAQIEDLIPDEWDEFFETGERYLTQRVRFSHSGNMMLYFNWTSKTLQDPSGGNYRDIDWFKEMQRKNLARFMQMAGDQFSVQAMTKIGVSMGDTLEHLADDMGMRGSLEEDKKMKLDRKYLTSLVTEVMNESLSGMFSTVEYAKQALELAIESGMIPKPSKIKETVFDTIQVHFNTHEELKQFMNFLEDQGVPRQLGISNVKKPTYFVFKSFAGDLPTALTLKL